jgi:dihydrofolate reductase
MRKLIVGMMASLDGVIQAPGGPEEDPSEDFRFGGWVFPFWDEVGDAAMGESFARPFALLLGRKTYEIFAAYWPYQEGEIADPFNAATKYVATSSAAPLAWRNSVRLEGGAIDAVSRLKQGDGPDLLTQGSATLVRALLAAGLVDELFLLVYPVLLGKGKRWFGDEVEPGEWALADTRTSTTGVLISRYRPKGPVRTGSFAQEAPSEAELARREQWKEEG